MSNKLKEAPEKQIEGNGCQHYWLIEDARGSTSRGVCKLCGEEREFYNSWPAVDVLKKSKDIFESFDSPEAEPGEEQGELELEESGAGL